MSEESSGGLPPLGQTTPAVTRASRPWYWPPAAVGILGLVLGLALGAVIGVAVSDGDEHESEGVTEAATETDTSVRRGPTTTAATSSTVPPECLDALRSAEQALQLVQQGVQSLRDLQVDDVNRTVSDLDRLRSGFSASVGQCNERLGS